MSFSRGILVGAILTTATFSLVQLNIREDSAKLQSSIREVDSTTFPLSSKSPLLQDLLSFIPVNPKLDLPKLPNFKLKTQQLVESWNTGIDRVAKYLLEEEN